MTTTIGEGGAERRHPDPDKEPATAVGPCDDATTIVPPPSEVAPDLAWSADDDERVSTTAAGVLDPLAVPWGLVWGIAAAIVVVCVLAAIVGAMFFLGSQEKARDAQALGNPVVTGVPTTMPATALPPISSEPLAPPTQAPVAAPQPPTVTVTATPHAPPPPAPAPAPDPDTVFRNFVRGIPGVTVINWEVAEAGAHRVCGYLRAGHSHDDATQQVLANDPTFTAWQASATVNASVTAYCPDQQ
ncbi:DUF732 domain-containing protein [Mycobacterium sp. HNNTM2301]|uniref:DUF732 domain-containing protein n=1 Tax=Mycobacterium hainanense TaxID=3289775 RepID=UPI0035A6A001